MLTVQAKTVIVAKITPITLSYQYVQTGNIYGIHFVHNAKITPITLSYQYEQTGNMVFILSTMTVVGLVLAMQRLSLWSKVYTELLHYRQ